MQNHYGTCYKRMIFYYPETQTEWLKNKIISKEWLHPDESVYAFSNIIFLIIILLEFSRKITPINHVN